MAQDGIERTVFLSFFLPQFWLSSMFMSKRQLGWIGWACYRLHSAQLAHTKQHVHHTYMCMLCFVRSSSRFVQQCNHEEEYSTALLTCVWLDKSIKFLITLQMSNLMTLGYLIFVSVQHFLSVVSHTRGSWPNSESKFGNIVNWWHVS